MTDPSQFPLETSHGTRPRSGLGERILVGLAVMALLGGVMVAAGNVLNHDAETAAASGQASPSVTSPPPTPSFDDPAAATCHYQPDPQEWAYASDQQGYRDSCRQTFVVTQVTDVSGP